MRLLARLASTVALAGALTAPPAAAVNVDGTWSICFPNQNFFNCGPFTGTMTAVGNAFTITLDLCTIHGTVDATTGAITVPPGECPQGSMLQFTGTATDTTFDATVNFALCPTFMNVSAVRACPACDDGNACTTDGCGATPCSAPSSSCTIGSAPSGTLCNDGVACTTGDVCQGSHCAGAPVVCGDNNPCTDDMCDAGTGACVFAPNHAPCIDGTFCTTNDACSGGICVGGPALQCAPCQRCRPLAGCVTEPKPCQASLGKAKLLLKDDPDDVRDKVKWSWGKGVTALTNPFGDPLTTDDYTLCIFDGAGPSRRLFLGATAPAGGTCTGGGSCWLGRGTPPGAKGYVYRDSKILLPDGLKKIQLRPGVAGRGKATAAGAGPNLALPSPMNVALPVVVQLQGESSGCFESVFTDAKVSTEDVFQAVTSPSPAFLDAR